IWAVILGIAAIVAAGFGAVYLVRSATLAPFQKNIGEYTPARGQLRSGTGPAYVKGKLIPVSFGKGKTSVDWMYFSLPSDLGGGKPEEVGTIVWLEWSDQKVGDYTDGSSALVYHCKVAVIDKESRLLLAEQDFRGGDPPESDSGSGDVHGSKPDKD